MEATTAGTAMGHPVPIEAERLEYLSGLPPDDRLPTVLSWAGGGCDPGGLGGQGVDPGRPARDRVRLLAAVERLGVPLDADQWLDLTIAARRYGRTVQRQIARLLAGGRSTTVGPLAGPGVAGAGGVERP